MLDPKLEKKKIQVKLNSKKRCVSFPHLQSLKLTACSTHTRLSSSLCKAHIHTGNTQVTCFSSTPPQPPLPSSLLPPSNLPWQRLCCVLHGSNKRHPTLWRLAEDLRFVLKHSQNQKICLFICQRDEGSADVKASWFLSFAHLSNKNTLWWMSRWQGLMVLSFF